MGGNVDRQDRRVNMGHKISWEKRETHFQHFDLGMRGFSLEGGKQQRDGACWSQQCSCADTTHMEGFSKLSLFLDGGRLTTTHQLGFFVETEGRGEKDGIPASNKTTVDEGEWLRNNWFYDTTTCSPGRHDCLTRY